MRSTSLKHCHLLRSVAAIAAALILGGAAGSAAGTPGGVDGTATEVYQALPAGFTAEGHAFRGDPDAPLTMVEYSDYLCPFCGRYFSQTLPTLLEKYGRTGRVKFVARDLPIAALHPTAAKGAAAGRCVGEQGAARFWQMYERLLGGQHEWNHLADPASFLANAARGAGADMNAYEACMASGRQDIAVQQSVAAAQALGFNGTPTFQFVHRATGKVYSLVGAQPAEVFARWIDDLLTGKEPPREAQPEPAPAPKFDVPFWATPEGLAPDPGRPGFTAAGDRYKGDPEARFVMIEFSDFECAACQRHALSTQPELDRRFIETGEVRWVVKHFPLGRHSHAPVAAAAAQCAEDQGKFWSMHHALFERMDEWSKSDDVEAVLVRMASDVGLDASRFTTCLNGRHALARVLRDVYDGQAVGVRNVPAFVLLQGETPFVLVGARSTEQFSSLLRRQIDRARSAAAPVLQEGGATPR